MPALRLFILLLSFSLCGAVAIAKPVTETDLRKHVEILASDDFEGRAPGTEGERKTLAYLVPTLLFGGEQPKEKDKNPEAP